MTADLYFISLGMPALIVIAAYTAVRIYERDFDRKHKHRQPGE